MPKLGVASAQSKSYDIRLLYTGLLRSVVLGQ